MCEIKSFSRLGESNRVWTRHRSLTALKCRPLSAGPDRALTSVTRTCGVGNPLGKKHCSRALSPGAPGARQQQLRHAAHTHWCPAVGSAGGVWWEQGPRCQSAMCTQQGQETTARTCVSLPVDTGVLCTNIVITQIDKQVSRDKSPVQPPSRTADQSNFLPSSTVHPVAQCCSGHVA